MKNRHIKILLSEFTLFLSIAMYGLSLGFYVIIQETAFIWISIFFLIASMISISNYIMMIHIMRSYGEYFLPFCYDPIYKKHYPQKDLKDLKL